MMIQSHSDQPADHGKLALVVEAKSWASRVRDLAIIDKASCEQAQYLLRSIKGVRADIQRWFAPHVDKAAEAKRAATAAHKALVDESDRIQAPLVAGETTVKAALLLWDREENDRRRAEVERLELEARERAERDTLEAAAALEREARNQTDPVLADAMHEEAADLLAQPIDVPAVLVRSDRPKVQGVTYRDHWIAHPDIDVVALCRAIAAGTAPVNFLLPNKPAINAWVRATQGQPAIPGIRVVNDRQIAARG